jgi:hypothetical protein
MMVMTMDERVEAAARGLRAIALVDEDTARRYAEAVLLGGAPEFAGAAVYNECRKRWEEWVRKKRDEWR